MSEFVFGCEKCGKFTGYIPRKTPPPKTINTVCSVCGARLRISPDSYRFNSSRIFAKGKGAHHRSRSVWKIIPWNRETAGHSAKMEAAKMNRELADLARQRAEEEKGGLRKTSESGAIGDFTSAAEAKRRRTEELLKKWRNS